jgi:hypothetical protein
MKQSISLVIISSLALVALAGCDAQPGSANAAQPGMTPRAFIPSFSGGTSSDPQCAGQSPVVTITPARPTAQVGETITVTVILTNEGCDDAGLPQYRLWAEPRDAASLFEPAQIEPVVHSRAVGQHQTDSADFALRAVAIGEQAFGASVSYELHTAQGATWGMASAPPITITVQEP